jgi:hypothetical protein
VTVSKKVAVAYRLSILEPRHRSDNLRYHAFQLAFGFYPDLERLRFARTRLDRSAFGAIKRGCFHLSPAWSKGELELFAAFVSALNNCNF